MEPLNILLFLIIGVVVGLCSGLLGFGGAILVNPILWSVFEGDGLSANLAVMMTSGTMLIVIFMNNQAGLFAHIRKGVIPWRMVSLTVIFSTLGVVCGVTLSTTVNQDYVRGAFAVLQIVAATKMLLASEPKPDEKTVHHNVLLTCVAFAGGLISGTCGVGGGLVYVPFLVAGAGIGMQQAIALSSCAMIINGLVGGLLYAWRGWGVDHLPWGAAGYVNVPVVLCIVSTGMITGYFAAKASHLINKNLLRKIFSVILYFFAAKILFF